MKLALSKAFRDLTKRRVRSLLTLLGIMIGVAGIMAIVSTSKNMALAQASAYNSAAQADVTFSTWEVPDNLGRGLLGIPNVVDADVRSTFYTKWKVGDTWQDLILIAFRDYGQMRIDKIQTKEGSLPSPGGITLDISARDLNPVNIGDEIVYRSPSGEVTREKTLKVVGFSKSPNYVSASIMNMSVGYVTMEDLRRMLGTEANNQVQIKLEDIRVRDETVERVKDYMGQRGFAVSRQESRDPDNFPGKRELDSLIALMFLFSVVGLVTSGFLVANTLSGIIGEQVGEIGAMKALGATRGQVLSIYLTAAALYGIVGTVIGLVVGLLGGWLLLRYLSQLMNLEFEFTLEPSAFILGSVVGIGVAVVAGLIPAWTGTSLTVREALRSYGINSTYGSGTIDKILQRIHGLPPLFSLSLRNLARRKTRTGVTLVVIALSCAAFLAAWSTDYTVRSNIDSLYGVYGADAFVWFQQPVGENFVGALRATEGVNAVESWSQTNAKINGFGTYLRGLPPETELYKKSMENGRWFESGEKDGIVVSADLASRLDIRIGDTVEIETAQKEGSYRVIGTVIDASVRVGSTSSGNIFLPTDVVLGLLERKGTASYFALTVDNPTPAGIKQVLSRIEEKYRGMTPASFSMDDDRENSRNLTKILTAMLYGMVIIVAVIGSIGVLNTLTLSILERRREIGVMRSMGATDLDILRIFLSEGLILGVAGSVAGLLIGYPLSRLFVGVLSKVLFEMEFYFEIWGVVGVVVFAILLSGFASLIPALGAARLSVNQALRYE